MSVLLELAVRCERAMGPDRELACSIAKAIGFDGGPLGSRTSSPWAWCPDYTASIDAAMTLVPDEYEGMSFVWSRTGCWSLCLYNSDIMAVGATRALALCAAALKARAASGTEAQRATTPQSGVVHDGPTGNAGDAQTPPSEHQRERSK